MSAPAAKAAFDEFVAAEDSLVPPCVPAAAALSSGSGGMGGTMGGGMATVGAGTSPRVAVRATAARAGTASAGGALPVVAGSRCP
ncbi:hypothetical protein PV703_04705 [Streptomyces sp. ME01-24h]|nr:hypothetical protein [Streptomyces sp. ME01-24h]